ncbi:MAG: SMI1/KNR4 family protein [Xanthomonadales bacterium]|nr:SMI1/KNR4 family protein [Xanthomonadales bacterium]
MECAECGASYPSPQMIDGIAYFVCAQCGNLHELDDYQLLDLAGQAARFARESGFTLPAAYLDYAGRSGSWMVRVPPAQSESLNGYFGDGFYEIGQFFDLDPWRDHGSVFNSAELCDEWGLPDKLVLIDGDGHSWLALDYRRPGEPAVIVIETDEMESLKVANSFAEMVAALVPYESVYDAEGNRIDQI